MSCFRFNTIDLNRLQKYYPISDPTATQLLFSNKPFEMGYLMIDVADTDTVNFTFTRPFSAPPSVVANFVSLNTLVGNVHVFVESVTSTGGVIKISAPATGRISLQAIYIPG